jgi:hypothetical protein
VEGLFCEGREMRGVIVVSELWEKWSEEAMAMKWLRWEKIRSRRGTITWHITSQKKTIFIVDAMRFSNLTWSNILNHVLCYLTCLM